MPTIFWVVLILILLGGLGSLPLFPYSSGWGYYPSGGLGLLLVVLIVFLVLRGGSGV
jgi:hypothetical protein